VQGKTARREQELARRRAKKLTPAQRATIRDALGPAPAQLRLPV
jgi:hypothetical protein